MSTVFKNLALRFIVIAALAVCPSFSFVHAANIKISALEGQNLLTDSPQPLVMGEKGAVVVFLSAKCPCSNSHASLLRKLAEGYKEFRFYGIHSNADESRGEAQKYFQSVGLHIPIIDDRSGLWADEFKALKTPHAFVLNPTGDIVYKGGVTNSNMAETADKQLLSDALADLKAGRSVRTPEARTVGCMIARAK
jgi:hypothetical protein